MIIKGKTQASYIVTLCSTFLLVGLVLFYTTVPTLAAQNYYSVNDTVYMSANAYGLEDLPYGVNTGVVQFQYGTNYLTLYFDKFTVYDEFVSDDLESTNLHQHYWNAYYVVNDDGSYDYKINIASDSPIYYKLSYDSDHKFSSSIGSDQVYSVTYVDGYYELNGSPLPIIRNKDYLGYKLQDYNLSKIVPADWSLKGERRIYSNVFMVSLFRYDDNFYYQPVKAGGQKNFVNGTSVGYNVEYYPSCEYLQNSQIRSTLVNQWNMMMSIDDKLDSVLSELYSVNSYLMDLLTYSQWIYNDLALYLPWIENDLAGIIDILNEIKSGPEYDSSQGIGSNTEFGDSFGNLTEDTVVPGIGTDSVVHSLGNSFLFIRNMFDRITVEFNLVYIITFLLGLSFIAYVLGRVIRNKMNG